MESSSFSAMEVGKECEVKRWDAEAMNVEEETGKIEEKSFHEKLALDTILDLENREREKNIEKWYWYYWVWNLVKKLVTKEIFIDL